MFSSCPRVRNNSPCSDHFHRDEVVPSRNRCCTETVTPYMWRSLMRRYTVAPSSDHLCIGIVMPSSDHCYTHTLPPSSDHHCTKHIAPPSDHLHPKDRNNVNYLERKNSTKLWGAWPHGYTTERILFTAIPFYTIIICIYIKCLCSSNSSIIMLIIVSPYLIFFHYDRLIMTFVLLFHYACLHARLHACTAYDYHTLFSPH